MTSAGLVRARNTPPMLHFNSPGSRAVGADRLSEIAHQRKNKNWNGKAMIRNLKSGGEGNKSRTDPGRFCLTRRIGKA